jgi:hypothetical protein
MLLVKNSIVRQNKRKQQKKQKKPQKNKRNQHFDVRGPWAVEDKNLLDSFIIDVRTTVFVTIK